MSKHIASITVALLLLVTATAHAAPSAQQQLASLAKATPIERWKAIRVLDRSQDTTIRKVYDGLDAKGQARLLQLVKEAGQAASAAGLQQTGIISDFDDTAFPTTYTPDGAYQLKGAGDFYRLVGLGTDGKGDPANIHFVTARISAFFGNSRARLKAAGVPVGTIDGQPNALKFFFGGQDAIQASKIKNIDLWMKLHPGQRFVLLGDTVQRDPEVYRWAIQNHPDQVELALIHKAGGPERDPKQYAGEIFFGDYTEAAQIVTARQIPQPGARQPQAATDLDGLPLPDTNVTAMNGEKKKENVFEKVGDFFKENVGVLFKKKPAQSSGIVSAIPAH